MFFYENQDKYKFKPIQTNIELKKNDLMLYIDQTESDIYFRLFIEPSHLWVAQASYTSKMCPMCGCIEDENRPNQETFECIECGYKDNADFNAAKNIRNRVLVTVLRESLLKQLDNGAFEPRKLKREKVKEVLLSFRRSLQNVGSECTESSVTTFDYV